MKTKTITINLCGETDQELAARLADALQEIGEGNQEGCGRTPTSAFIFHITPDEQPAPPTASQCRTKLEEQLIDALKKAQKGAMAGIEHASMMEESENSGIPSAFMTWMHEGVDAATALVGAAPALWELLPPSNAE